MVVFQLLLSVASADVGWFKWSFVSYFFFFIVDMSDLVHNVEAMHGLY